MSNEVLVAWVEEEARSKQRVNDVGAFDNLARDVRFISDEGITLIKEVTSQEENKEKRKKQGVDDVGAFNHLDMDVRFICDEEDIPDIYMVEIGVQNTNVGNKDGQDNVVEILGDRIVVAYNVANNIGLGDTTVDDNNGVDNIVADTNIHGDNNVLGDIIKVDNNKANTNMDKGKGPNIKKLIILKHKTLVKGKGIMIEGEIMLNKKKKHVFKDSGLVIRENENPSMDNDSESDTNNYNRYHNFDAIESDSEQSNRKENLKDATLGKQRGSKKYPSETTEKPPEVPGKAGRPEKQLVDVADEVVVLEFVSNEINEFHRVDSSNHVVFNNGSRIDLGSNWNKNKRGAKSAVV
uniref:Uncharacterized protein n=1 Tax=Tanacetum cinerariifolium TaxID=118510 RepID=A0A6L2K7Q3_TANCI|nr:hypothetical protein [Tanacetum cinerariifolium]